MTAATDASSLSETRQSVLMHQLFAGSRPGTAAEQFYPVFLRTLVEACAAGVVCVWLVREGRLVPAFHQPFDLVGLQVGTDSWAWHEQLVSALAQQGVPVGIPPHRETPVGTNPLSYELLFLPLVAQQQLHALVEVIRSPDPSDGPMSQRLADLGLWCEFLRDYLHGARLTVRAGQAETENLLRTFVTRLHSAGSPLEAATIAVHEARQVLGCDRVSLGWLQGGRTQLVAISGQDSVDHRSQAVQALTALATAAVRSGQPFQIDAVSATNDFASEGSGLTKSSHDAKAAESSRAAWQSYPEQERSRALWVFPIPRPASSNDERRQPLGALIVEQFRSDPVSTSLEPRAVHVTEQIGVAMSRARLLAAVPLLSVWNSLATGSWLLRCGRLLLIAGLMAIVFALASLPMELRLAASGELLAESRQTLFAPEEGVVREVLVRQGESVVAGQPLLSLDNLELVSRRSDLAGQLLQLQERRKTLEARRTSTQLNERDQLELQGHLLEIAVSTESLQRQIELLQQRLDRLKLLAPAVGTVITWNPDQVLLNRPCQPGDALLQQIDPRGAWSLELRIPEDRAGYVLRRLARLRNGERLAVDFVLATEPERRYRGFLRELAPRTELTSDGHVLRATVDLDETQLPPLRDGAEVTARLNCGSHSIGFVWLRELIEVAQTYWW